MLVAIDPVKDKVQEKAKRFIESGIGGNILANENPESIASGASGYIVFLLAVYQAFPEEGYLALIRDSIKDLVRHCKENPTGDYSLYTGRAGAVYVIIQYYLITGSSLFLKDAQDLIRPANQAFLHSKYTPDNLYEGRAGTLLVLWHLFLITQENFLLDHANEFIDKIISNAHLSYEGIYWKTEEEFNLRPLCGYAYGVSGISYVFNLLNKCQPNEAFEYILHGAGQFIDHSWVEDYQNWGNFRKKITDTKTLNYYKESYINEDEGLLHPINDHGWAEGSVGIAIGILSGNDNAKHSLDQALRNIIANAAFSSNSLYDGSAGAGLLCLELMEDKFASDWQESGNFDGGLLFSDMGGMYLQLKKLHSGGPYENILMPFKHFEIKTDQHYSFTASLCSVKKQLLSKWHPQTIHFLTTFFGESLTMYLQLPWEKNTDELLKFATYIEEIVLRDASKIYRDRLEDVFVFETEKLQFSLAGQKTAFEVYFDQLIYYNEVLHELNKPDDWLLRQKISISDSIRIIKTRWDWSRNAPTEKKVDKLALNLKTPAGYFEYILQAKCRNENPDTVLKFDKLILLHAFDEPKSIEEAVTAIKRYISSIPQDELIELLTKYTAFFSIADFYAVMDRILFYYIRQWILGNILVLHKND